MGFARRANWVFTCMTKSLCDYSASQFPNHELVAWGGTTDQYTAALTSDTVVVQVVGERKGFEVYERIQKLTAAPLSCVDVLPTESSVVPTEGEDGGGVIDLPGRRIVAGLLLGAFFGAIVMAAAGLLASDSVQTVAVLAFFGALAGAAVGGIFSGGRLAGQRASFQPQAPGERIVVIAVLLDNEPEALSLVRSMESSGVDSDVEFRLVDELGGWRSPST